MGHNSVKTQKIPKVIDKPSGFFVYFVRFLADFRRHQCLLVGVSAQKLLPDAEFGEDIVEDVIGGDLAGNLAQMVQDPAQILA